MYFASAEEQRYVQRGLLPESRRQRVSDELRGWNWYQPPLKPIYAQPLAVHEIAGKYCPTGRDVFLRRVQGIHSPPSGVMREGRFLHHVVANLLVEAKRLVYIHGAGSLQHLDGLGELPFADIGVGAFPLDDRELVEAKARALRSFEARRVVERVQSVLAHHPHAGPDALAVLALPVSVEVKLNGRYLGLSEHLSADAIAFPEMLVLELKFGPKEPFHRLTTTAYALVLESLFETPVDVGCVVYPRVTDGRVVIERDFHLIGDELRQMFIEERDEKMRLVSEELDPGLPGQCPQSCPYLTTCHPVAQLSAQTSRKAMPANVGPRPVARAAAAP